ncbi:MAG: M28 family peptidase [Bacteroidota bacterium]
MLIDQIKQLEQLSDLERFQLIIHWLRQMGIKPKLHKYATGTNIIVPTLQRPYYGLASHFDTVYQTPGANDNCSAIVVCLAVLRKLQASPFHRLGLQVFFFDQEEVGLKGSQAWIRKYGIRRMKGLLNLEMLGQGNHFALWPLTASHSGTLLQAFEQTATEQKISCDRYDRIVMNTADHAAFRKAGLEDCFTLTCISDQDREVAYHYYKALEFDVSPKTLMEIMERAPIFKHYHQPSDLSDHLSEESLQRAVDAIWATFQRLDDEA